MVSAQAEAALYGKLSTRFNSLLAGVAAAYAIQPFTIDFASAPKSPNFFLGNIDVEDIEKNTVYSLPLMTLYSVQSVNQYRQKPAAFSGTVRLGVDCALSWRGGNAYQDFNQTAHAVEDVMNTINNELAQAGFVVSVSMDRGPVKRGQQNWVQLLRFNFLFEILS